MLQSPLITTTESTVSPRTHNHDATFRFFRTASTVTACAGAATLSPAPAPPNAAFGASPGFATDTDPKMCDLYVSSDATGSGNGFGDTSGSSLPPRLGGGVRGTSSLARVGVGSGVRSRCPRGNSSGADDAPGLIGTAGALSIPSHRPRMAPSRVSVARAARSTVENSCPFRRLATTRRTRFGATWPGCGASGDGAELDSVCEVDTPGCESSVGDGVGSE